MIFDRLKAGSYAGTGHKVLLKKRAESCGVSLRAPARQTRIGALCTAIKIIYQTGSQRAKQIRLLCATAWVLFRRLLSTLDACIFALTLTYLVEK